ncbi:hypothetical protein [Acinetobacter johnsonii]|uniref:hypothetical protein n=1 Tax=Acinetobacter johnsonii TaxID=40214 RepID=UPI0010391728|nr:hypothetical protein [Acinetobacter johnsonii]QBK69578.1 hypothetical protein E0Z08_08580 [Acinetobacter johnsonii]
MLSLSDIVNVKVGIGRGVFEAPGATVIGGKKPSFNLEILKLFANGEQGFWYDPNDLSTMFQDAAGTVSVTGVGQPLGLIRDKSGRGNHASQTTSASRPILRSIPILGTEVIVDPEFNDPSYWNVSSTGTTSVSGGFAHFNAAPTGNNVNTADVITLGKTYQLTFTISSISGGAIRPAISIGTGNVNFANFNKVGTYTVVAVASGKVPTIQITAIGDTTATVDSISVKEVLGYKTNTFIEYDGIDDKLITTLSAQLTGCTVIRSVPNVGTQILTNQTIPATYEDNKDHCGLIVINRALTPSETSAIAAEFNKRAGV